MPKTKEHTMYKIRLCKTGDSPHFKVTFWFRRVTTDQFGTGGRKREKLTIRRKKE